MRSDFPRSRRERRELAINLVETRTTRSPRATRNRSSAPETCRQSSSAQARSLPRPRAHSTSAPTREPRRRSSSQRAPGPSPRDRRDRVRTLVGVRPDDHPPVPFHLAKSGHPADRACFGRCHAPIKSRRTSPTGDERHNKSKSRHPGRQPQRESARRPVGTFTSVSEVTNTADQNSKPQSSSGAIRWWWSGTAPVSPLNVVARAVVGVTHSGRFRLRSPARWPSRGGLGWRPADETLGGVGRRRFRDGPGAGAFPP
jgi:hypothetical protein